MRTANTFSILFWIYETRAKNDLANIYVRITVNGKKVNISLKQKVLIQNWNKEKQRAKGKDKVSQIVNQHLDRTHSKLVEIYHELKFQDKYITAELIKATYLGEGDNFKTLQNIMEYHKRKTERTLSSGTIRNFDVTESYLNKFLDKELKLSDIYLKQLDYRFICDFEHFLHTYWPKGHPKAMGHNTVMKHIQRFRKIITLAYHLEWLERDPFILWKPTWEKSEREFLSENELSNLETYRFPIDRLDRVRDLFVFSCYTGISYADTINLSPEKICKGIDGGEFCLLIHYL